MDSTITYTLPNNNTIDFVPRNDGLFVITNQKGDVFVAELPRGVLTYDDEIAHDLIAKVYIDDALANYKWLDIGFGNGNNKAIYKDVQATLKAQKVEIEGYTELKALIESHAAYHAHLNDCLDKGVTLSMTQPANFEPLAAQYPQAATLLKAEKYQNSDNIDKYSAGKIAAELVKKGELGQAQELLNNWHKSDV